MDRYDRSTSVIIDKLYPMIAKSLDKNLSKFKNAIFDFINANSSQLYDIAPYDVIYYKQRDIENLFKAVGFTDKEVESIMVDCFYWKLPYNPQAAKEPYVLVCMMAIRYCLIQKKRKEAELITVYLAFSGKFYASLFTGVAFPTVPPSKYKTVMDYVINNMLTDKFDLRTQGNVFGAVRSLCLTWLDTYGPDLMGKVDDDKVGKMIQQLRDREKSFLMNIAKLYYSAYENKNYLNYETDNLSDGTEFRITDNDSLKATRYTENTINYLVTNAVSLQICNKCKDQNIKATEVKDIMESIISDKNNLNDIYRVVNILICDFMRNYPGKSVGSIDFIANSIKMKPNSKDKYILEMKETILHWLDENSASYRKRKSRVATAISYYKAVLMYLVLAISYAAK